MLQAKGHGECQCRVVFAGGGREYQLHPGHGLTALLVASCGAFRVRFSCEGAGDDEEASGGLCEGARRASAAMSRPRPGLGSSASARRASGSTRGALERPNVKTSSVKRERAARRRSFWSWRDARLRRPAPVVHHVAGHGGAGVPRGPGLWRPLGALPGAKISWAPQVDAAIKALPGPPDQMDVPTQEQSELDFNSCCYG